MPISPMTVQAPGSAQPEQAHMHMDAPQASPCALFSITTRFPFDTEGRFPFDTAAAAAPGGGGAGPAPSAALGGHRVGRTKPDAPPSKRRSVL